MDSNQEEHPCPTNRQDALVHDLNEIDSTLAHLYNIALNEIAAYNAQAPEARAKLCMIAHAVRELVNRFPDATSPDAVPKTKREEENRAKEKFFQRCNEDLPFTKNGDNGVIISKELFEAMQTYQTIHKLGSLNQKTRTRIALTSSPTGSTPALTPWEQAYSFFMHYVHYNGPSAKELPSAKAIADNLRIIENVLSVSLSRFFSAKHDLDILLEQANRIDANGNYSIPDKQTIYESLSLANNPHLERYLFGRLENPLWFDDLQKLGALAMHSHDGSNDVNPTWPASYYLLRCAKAIPQKVSTVLERETKDPSIVALETLSEAAALLPTEHATGIANKLANWASSGYGASGNASIWQADAIAKTIANLTKNPQTARIGKNLLNAVFSPQEESRSYWRSFESCIPSYSYRESLLAATSNLDCTTRVMFSRSILRRYCQLHNIYETEQDIRLRLVSSVSGTIASAEVTEVGAVIELLANAFSEMAQDDFDLFAKWVDDAESPITQHIALFALESLLQTDALQNNLYDACKALSERQASLGRSLDLEADRKRAVLTSGMAVFSAPNSPMSLGEMRTKEPEALFEHLQNWHPEGKWNPEASTHNGQGYVLQNLVSSNPFVFEGFGVKVHILRPTYLRSIIYGWISAIESGKDVPTDDFINLVIWGATINPKQQYHQDGDEFDDDGNYSSVVKASVRAICTALRSKMCKELSDRDIGQLAVALNSAVQTGYRDDDYSAEQGLETSTPFQAAINATVPLSLEALAYWLDAFDDNPAKELVLSALESHLPGKSDWLSDAAVMGESVPILLRCVPDWVGKHIAELFGAENPDGPNECQQVVFTTMLALWSPGEDVFKLSRPAITLALQNGCDEYLLGFRNGNSTCSWFISNWIIRALFTGILTFDDPLLAFWEHTVDPSTRGSVLRDIMRLLNREEQRNESVTRNALMFWDHCRSIVQNDPSQAPCLTGIAWIARGNLATSTWWALRFVDEARLNPDFDDLGMAADALLTLSEEEPVETLSILEAVVESHAVFRPMWAIRKLAPVICANALLIHETSIEQRTRTLMDKLGSNGFLDLEELVEEQTRQ